MGALRSGAGLVSVATPRSSPAHHRRHGRRVHDRAARRDPGGAGRRQCARNHPRLRAGCHRGWSGARYRAKRHACSCATLLERSEAPLVLDADALNVLASDPDRLQNSEEGARPSSLRRIPARWPGWRTHPSTRCRRTVSTSRAISRLSTTSTSCSRAIARSSPRLTARCSSIRPGNPGMATGGTGDVLAGMIAAWLAQLLDAEAACRLGVYLHGAGRRPHRGRRGRSRHDRRRSRSPSRRCGARVDRPKAGEPVKWRLLRSSITASERETFTLARTSGANADAGNVRVAVRRSRCGKDRVRAGHRLRPRRRSR